MAERDLQIDNDAAATRPASASSDGSAQAPLVAFTIAATLVLGALVVVVPASLLVFDQGQGLETALFTFAFGVGLPLAIYAGLRLSALLSRSWGSEKAASASAVMAAGLAAAVVLARLAASVLDAASTGLVLAFGLLWAAGALALMRRAARPAPPNWPSLRTTAPIAAAAAAAAILALAEPRSLAAIPFICCLLLGAGAVVALRRGRLPRLRGWKGAAVDVALVVLVLLAVPDVILYVTGGAISPGPDPSFSFYLQLHQNFYLGPANDVLAGEAVLVDTLSQYGVGPIYAIAAWFQVAPVGYGTLGLLGGILSALSYAGAYAIMRLGGCSRVVAAIAVVVALFATVYSAIGPPGLYPSLGPLRFGLPLLLLVLAVAAARGGRGTRLLAAAQLAVVGLASIWSVETLVFTGAVFAAVTAIEALAAQARVRDALRHALVRAGFALAACVVAHLLFAAATLAFAGELPDWGSYLSYFGVYSSGELSDVSVFDFAAWSPGLGVAAAYLASFAGLAVICVMRRDLLHRDRPAIVAIAGTTGCGLGFFTYFVGHSTTLFLPSVSLPAVVMGALWLGLALRDREAFGDRARIAVAALAAWIAAILVAAAWTETEARFGDTALAHAAPGGGKSLHSAVERLWDSPPVDPRAPEGAELIERYFDPGPVLVIAEPELATGILVTAERPGALPTDPREADIARSVVVPEVRETVESLQPGTLMLTQESVLAEPLPPDPLAEPVLLEELVHTVDYQRLVPLQQWALALIEERFRLVPVAVSPSGLEVVRLEPRG